MYWNIDLTAIEDLLQEVMMTASAIEGPGNIQVTIQVAAFV